MRYVLILSTVLAVFGVVLVSGSLVMVPYTVMEEVRVDRSKMWVDDTFVLIPLKNRTYNLDSIVENISIIQVDVDSSDYVVFQILSSATDEVWFERETRWDVESYWTPPSLGYGNWRFVFHNPSPTSENVSVKVTEFYLKATEEREATYYRSLFDSFYGYSGVVAIIVAIGLNVIHISREAKRRD